MCGRFSGCSDSDDDDDNAEFYYSYHIDEIFIFCITVPYSGDALRKMIDKQHEEIKQKLHKFAEIMKKEHVRISLK